MLYTVILIQMMSVKRKKNTMISVHINEFVVGYKQQTSNAQICNIYYNKCEQKRKDQHNIFGLIETFTRSYITLTVKIFLLFLIIWWMKKFLFGVMTNDTLTN